MTIAFDKQKHTPKQIFEMLNPRVSGWFKEKFKTFTEPQLYSIPNIHYRQNTLISAETGTGKTLSAFTAILSELHNYQEQGTLEDKIYCVYISPLRALNNDIKKNLLDPLEAIKEKAKKRKERNRCKSSCTNWRHNHSRKS